MEFLILFLELIITIIVYLSYPTIRTIKKGKLPLNKARFYSLINIAIGKFVSLVIAFFLGGEGSFNILTLFIYYCISVRIMRIKVSPEESKKLVDDCLLIINNYFSEEKLHESDKAKITKEINRVINEHAWDSNDPKLESRFILRSASFRILCQDVLNSNVQSEIMLRVFNDTSAELVSANLLTQEDYEKNLEYLSNLKN